jgi:hypothetical protein
MARRKSVSSSTGGVTGAGGDGGGGAGGGGGVARARVWSRLRNPRNGAFSGAWLLGPFGASAPARDPRRGMAAMYHRAPARRY